MKKRTKKTSAVKKIKKHKQPPQKTLKKVKPAAKRKIYQFKITLKDISPKIWRRFAAPADMSLHDLSMVIIEVMGWSGAHLYAYHIGGLEYGMPDDELDADKGILADDDVLVKDALKEKQQFEYVYDFGDDWRHQLVVEKITEADPEMKYPVCLGGERACPPEDCGGAPGYEDPGEAPEDPNHERHGELSGWAGDYNPEEFDVKEVNERIKSIENQEDT
jgi:hypothetical protein